MSKKAKVIFHECLQDSQELGSDNEHMVSRIFFTFEIDGNKFGDLYVDLKQTVGSDFETGLIEVSSPRGYEGPFNHHVFREEVTQYYRDLVGSSGRAIRIQGGGKIRMQNNTLRKEKVIEFDVSGTDSSW